MHTLQIKSNLPTFGQQGEISKKNHYYCVSNINETEDSNLDVDVGLPHYLTPKNKHYLTPKNKH